MRRGERWLAVAALALVAGCGSDSKFANDPRPPAPITVTAAIDASRVRVSPERFGAGPITVIVSNQSGAPQDLTLETDEIGGSEGGIRRSVGPIGARSTGQIQADVRQGTYRLSVKSGAIRPAQLTVGAARKSSQDDLLQP